MKSKNVIVSVYKTILSEKYLQGISAILNNFVPVINWNIYLEDCDNILRIESKQGLGMEKNIVLHTLNIVYIELH